MHVKFNITMPLPLVWHPNFSGMDKFALHMAS